MHTEYRYRFGGRLFSGVLVVAIGVIFLLNNLDIIEARDIFRLWFWPILLIAFGVIQLLHWRSSQ